MIDQIKSMSKPHLSPEVVFGFYEAKRENIKYAFSFDYKNLALSSLKFLDKVSKIISFAGLNFYKGVYKDKEVIVANGGAYSPDTAVGTEILCFLGAEYLVRVGSCGSLREEINIGEAVLATSILDYTGVTKFYAGELNVSADLNGKIDKIVGELKTYKGKLCSYDALFKETKEMIGEMIKQDSIAVDMAVASFLKVAGAYNRQASSLLVVSDNLITGEIGFKNSVFYKKINVALRNIFKVLDYL